MKTRQLYKIQIILTHLIFFSVFSSLYSDTLRDPYEYFFQDSWGNFQEEIILAKQQGKKAVFIFFEMDECPFCHYMKTNILNQSKVQTYFRENFLLFSVDIEGDIEMVNFKGKNMKQKDFAFKENRVRATPVLAFFDFDGNRIHRHTGKTSGVNEFMLMGEYVAQGKYKEISFSKFKREKRKNKK